MRLRRAADKAAEAVATVPGEAGRVLVPSAASSIVVEHLDAPGGGDAVADPAVAAEAARGRAAAAREESARIRAGAQAEVQRIVAEAQAAAGRLEDEAAAAEAEAVEAQAAADRNTAIVAAEAELLTWRETRDRLAAEAGGLGDVIAEATARLDELAAQEAEAEQRQRMALQKSDVSGVREVMLDRAAVAEVAAAERARLSAAQARLAQIEAELARAGEAISGLGVRVAGLRREAAGLPPRDELARVAAAVVRQGVIALARDNPGRLARIMLGAVPEQVRGQMAELIRLGPVNPGGTLMVAEMAAATDSRWAAGIIAGLEQLAATNPAEYARVRDVAFKSVVLAEEPGPDRLAPGFAVNEAGQLTYLGHIPSLQAGG
jgi:hypothetical protein